MSNPPPRIAVLRALPEHRRAALLAHLEHGERGLSVHKARRQMQIVERHILGGESRSALCREFGISAQQFYADRRDGIRRALDALDERSGSLDEPAPALRGGPSPHLAHAAALHEAGASRAAAEVLETRDAGALHGLARVECVALGLEIGSDIGRELALTSLPRLRHERAAAAPGEAPFAEAALAWSAMYAASSNGSRSEVLHAFNATVRALRACEPFDARVPVLLARCLITMSPVLHEIAGTGCALEAIDAGVTLAESRADMPIRLRALAHANRACVYSGSLDTVARAAAERETALALALDNALPRTMWICLYLGVFDNIWRDNLAAALGDAQQLFASVRASDSLVWHRIARSRLSNACSAVGLLDDAERAIAPLGAAGGDSDPGLALQRCALTFRRARYRETLAQASAVVSAVADRAPHYHANALLYSAGAAYRLDDTARATADIVDAVDLFESSYTPTLFLAMRAFRLAHTITGRRRYHDAARDLQDAFEALESPVLESSAANRPSADTRAALTPRQLEIVRLAAGGATNRAIAAALGISARTVGNHLAAAYAALGVRARWQLRGRVDSG